MLFISQHVCWKTLLRGPLRLRVVRALRASGKLHGDRAWEAGRRVSPRRCATTLPARSWELASGAGWGGCRVVGASRTRVSPEAGPLAAERSYFSCERQFRCSSPGGRAQVRLALVAPFRGGQGHGRRPQVSSGCHLGCLCLCLRPGSRAVPSLRNPTVASTLRRSVSAVNVSFVSETPPGRRNHSFGFDHLTPRLPSCPGYGPPHGDLPSVRRPSGQFTRRPGAAAGPPDLGSRPPKALHLPPAREGHGDPRGSPGDDPSFTPSCPPSAHEFASSRVRREQADAPRPRLSLAMCVTFP